MPKRLLATVIGVGCLSCAAPPADPPLHPSPPLASHASALDEAAPGETWCFSGVRNPTHQLVLDVYVPNGQGYVQLVVPMMRCSDDISAFKNLPSACLSADSFGPRAWVNGCVTLRSTTPAAATADIDLSWKASEGREGVCRASIPVPLGPPFRQPTNCGVKVSGQFQLASMSGGGYQ